MPTRSARPGHFFRLSLPCSTTIFHCHSRLFVVYGVFEKNQFAVVACSPIRATRGVGPIFLIFPPPKGEKGPLDQPQKKAAPSKNPGGGGGLYGSDLREGENSNSLPTPRVAR